jgi:(heptosyl)LPS beta-1,4-glucosyltransferase
VYRVRRRNFYLGQELTRGRWGKDWVTRVFTRDRRYIERRVHERLEPAPNPGTLHACLDHVPYRDLSHQLEKMNRYARWGAEDLFERGRRATAWDLSVRPAARFLRAYLLQGACLDGRFGLTASALGAYTNFLKYAHLWALERRA